MSKIRIILNNNIPLRFTIEYSNKNGKLAQSVYVTDISEFNKYISVARRWVNIKNYEDYTICIKYNDKSMLLNNCDWFRNANVELTDKDLRMILLYTYCYFRGIVI